MRMSHFVSCSPDNPGVKAGVAKESTATTNSKRRRHLQDGGRGIGELIVTATEALPHNAEHTEGGFPLWLYLYARNMRHGKTVRSRPEAQPPTTRARARAGLMPVVQPRR